MQGMAQAAGRDLVSGEIICADPTADDVGDPSALPCLLDQIDGSVTRFLADGAHDGAPSAICWQHALAQKQRSLSHLRRTPLPAPQSTLDPSVRGRDIPEIHARGRPAWQQSTGYNQRSSTQTQMGRWKALIGPKLRARNLENQKTEALIGVRVLNRMAELERPEFKRIA